MRDRAETIREKIIRTADDLFYRNGYSHASFSDISAAVGISRGNFYYHFKTKDDILAAVIDYRKMIINNMTQNWELTHKHPHDRLYAYTDMIVQSKDDVCKNGCPVGSICLELIKMGNINQTDAADMIVLFRNWLRKQFLELGYKKQKSDQLAMHMISRTQGISLMANVFADKTFLLREIKQLKEWIGEL